MIEKFTDEEIEQIKKELEEREIKKQDKIKPNQSTEYKEALNRMFKDRPYHAKGSSYSPDIAIYCGRAIDTIVSLTLDCTEIKDIEKRHIDRDGAYDWHELHVKKTSKVPAELADEYYGMFDQVMSLMDEHLKPYKRFLEGASE